MFFFIVWSKGVRSRFLLFLSDELISCPWLTLAFSILCCQATVTFFDTTPTGRILNRFSSDLYCVDDSLPFILNIFLANMYGLLGMLVIITYGLPWIGLVLLTLAALYFSIQRYYRRTSRELKRLYSVTLSPIYTHFSETLSGLSSIRAMRATQR